jgi:hypothetical protein
VYRNALAKTLLKSNEYIVEFGCEICSLQSIPPFGDIHVTIDATWPRDFVWCDPWMKALIARFIAGLFT